MNYEVVELNQRVPNVDPELLTRFKWRADRRCRKRNSKRLTPSYRFEVCDWLDGRWAVVAMQNQLQPVSLTWICHVCGKKRPDDKISVYSTNKFIGDIPMRQNVRFCNDDINCIKGATTVDFMTKVD